MCLEHYFWFIQLSSFNKVHICSNSNTMKFHFIYRISINIQLIRRINISRVYFQPKIWKKSKFFLTISIIQKYLADVENYFYNGLFSHEKFLRILVKIKYIIALFYNKCDRILSSNNSGRNTWKRSNFSLRILKIIKQFWKFNKSHEHDKKNLTSLMLQTFIVY